MPLERYQMCGHILAQRMRELLSAAPLFITENGASWLLQHAEPPAEFVYAHSSAFTPASESERGLFLLPSAPGITPVSSAWRRIQGSAQQFVSSAAYGLGRGGGLETDGATDAEMSSGEGTEFAAWRPLEKVEPARCECRAGWGSCTPSKAETQWL